MAPQITTSLNRGGWTDTISNVPFYSIVNNGNNQPSLMQSLVVSFSPPVPNRYDSNTIMMELEDYSYGARVNIVPIAHDYYYSGEGLLKLKQGCFPISQNDFVNATWVSTQNDNPLSWGSGYFTYSGPMYTAALSESFYFAVEG
ncbi:MAG: hypothetical protein ACYDBI_09625 [Thermoplasmataceae archaeon]